MYGQVLAVFRVLGTGVWCCFLSPVFRVVMSLFYMQKRARPFTPSPLSSPSALLHTCISAYGSMLPSLHLTALYGVGRLRAGARQYYLNLVTKVRQTNIVQNQSNFQRQNRLRLVSVSEHELESIFISQATACLHSAS